MQEILQTRQIASTTRCSLPCMRRFTKTTTSVEILLQFEKNKDVWSCISDAIVYLGLVAWVQNGSS
jgi:hypothetical protein